jgi:hypothetical protein
MGGTAMVFNKYAGDEVTRVNNNGSPFIYYTGAWVPSKNGVNTVNLGNGNTENWHGSGGSWDGMTKEEMFHEFTLQPRPVTMLTFPDLGKALGAKGTYTVYKAITKDGGVYWGLTKNLAQRIAQHGKRFESIEAVFKNVFSKEAARGLEQLMIDASGGIKKLENSINSIGINNPNLMRYYQESIRYLKGL